MDKTTGGGRSLRLMAGNVAAGAIAYKTYERSIDYCLCKQIKDISGN